MRPRPLLHQSGRLPAAVIWLPCRCGSTSRVPCVKGISIPQLQYQIVLPRYDFARVAFKWRLIVKRYFGEQIMASGKHPLGDLKLGEHCVPLQRLDYVPESNAPTSREHTVTAVGREKETFLIVEGSIELKVGHDIDEARIILEYLPNIHDSEMIAIVDVSEAK